MDWTTKWRSSSFLLAQSLLRLASGIQVGSNLLCRLVTSVFTIYTGLFYVIDGFLDILLPSHKTTANEPKGKAEPADEEIHATRPGLGAWGASSHSRTSSFNVPGSRSKDTHKPLFTVRPGGIAGYLCV